MVVAFTSVGRGAENKPKYFFSQELTPTKAPENVHYKRLSAVSVNITWTPLTLFEARGFPIYKVSLQLPSTSNRRKKQSSLPESIITTSNFAVFNYLEKNRAYTAVVGVRTHSTEFQIAVAIHGNVLCAHKMYYIKNNMLVEITALFLWQLAINVYSN